MWEENSEVTHAALLNQYVQILYTYRDDSQELTAVSEETALPTTLICSNGNELITLMKEKVYEHSSQHMGTRDVTVGIVLVAMVSISLDCQVQTAMCQIWIQTQRLVPSLA